jgi:enediyne biosynthesis protein E4
MSAWGGFFRRSAARLVAAALIVTLYGFVPPPELSATEREELAARFNFSASSLPEPMPADTFRHSRDVNPSLKKFSAWISSVGASVALNDLDDDGLANDICYVDPRVDRVIVAPVPGTSPRYAPFILNPTSLKVDSVTTAPMGCLPGDLNEDGYTDLLVYYWGRTPIAFLNKGNRSSGDAQPLVQESYLPREVVPGGGRWYSNAATFADVDGDGNADLLVGNYFPDGARVLDPHGTGTEQMQDSMSRAYNGGRDRLLLWEGGTSGKDPTVRFREAKGVFDEQVARGWTLAMGAADLDGDLLPEIYFANDFGPDHLLHNLSKPGKPRFALLNGKTSITTPNSKVLGRGSFKGMGVDFGDVNGDGLPDIFVSNITTEYALEESNYAFVSTGQVDRMKDGVAPYVDRSEPLGLSRSGWGWDAKMDDFNNDGVLEVLQATGFVKGSVDRWPQLHELAMGNDELVSNPRSWFRLRPGDDLSGHEHNPFFARANDGRYYDLAPEIGLAQTQVSRGIATADVDGDGDLDFAVANQWAPSKFYRNDSPDPGSFLELRLLLPLRGEQPAPTKVLPGHRGSGTLCRSATDATVAVHLPDGRRLVAQVDGGNGHSGKRSPDLHFGLGQLSDDARVEVDLRWRGPDGGIHQQRLSLRPGWHTVLLGRTDGRSPN